VNLLDMLPCMTNKGCFFSVGVGQGTKILYYKSQILCNISIGIKSFKNVADFRYLGVTLTS
jgi:hypothetical protein